MATCSQCGNDRVIYQDTRCQGCVRAAKVEANAPASTVEDDLKSRKWVKELTSLRGKYNEALKTIGDQAEALNVLGFMQERTEPVVITAHEGQGTSEACPVIVASDWHSEELVNPSSVNGLNAFNPEIAEKRITTFFQASMRLVKLLNVDVRMHTIILALLGDFITNELHGAENAELNAMGPTDAIVFVQNLIIGGIEFYLNNCDFDILIVCKGGNHARTTLKTRFSAENSHSLEYLLYRYLAAYFRSEARVRFVIEDGYHTYLPIYGETARFHHGHAVKYGGGVGGLTIPANKAIASWNQGRQATLDIFGHFHQRLTTRRFAANGSLIGYNGFAVAIKAEYEPPMQSLLLFDKKRGKTCEWPILLER